MVLEALVFYHPQCTRCKDIRNVISSVRGQLKGIVRFSYINCAHKTGEWLADKYKIDRIPSILVKTTKPDVYFVGVPTKKDLVSVLTYLSVHPEGGKGVHGYNN